VIDDEEVGMTRAEERRLRRKKKSATALRGAGLLLSVIAKPDAVEGEDRGRKETRSMSSGSRDNSYTRSRDNSYDKSRSYDKERDRRRSERDSSRHGSDRKRYDDKENEDSKYEEERRRRYKNNPPHPNDSVPPQLRDRYPRRDSERHHEKSRDKKHEEGASLEKSAEKVTKSSEKPKDKTIDRGISKSAARSGSYSSKGSRSEVSGNAIPENFWAADIASQEMSGMPGSTFAVDDPTQLVEDPYAKLSNMPQGQPWEQGAGVGEPQGEYYQGILPAGPESVGYGVLQSPHGDGSKVPLMKGGVQKGVPPAQKAAALRKAATLHLKDPAAAQNVQLISPQSGPKVDYIDPETYFVPASSKEAWNSTDTSATQQPPSGTGSRNQSPVQPPANKSGVPNKNDWYLGTKTTEATVDPRAGQSEKLYQQKAYLKASAKDSLATQRIKESQRVSTQYADGAQFESIRSMAEDQMMTPNSRGAGPMFDVLSDLPTLLAESKQEFCMTQENYLRGILWSPDGQCLLSNSDDNILRVYDIPSTPEDAKDMLPTMRMSEGETVYDMMWYPFASLQETATLCFATTSRDHPIHLWDAYVGRVRCSYKAYNHVDELTAAHSVAFHPTGTKIYAGFNKMIRIFDASRPGRECEERPTYVKVNPNQKGKLSEPRLNQSGIISSISFSNEHIGIYACGSFSKSVGLYHANTDQCIGVLNGHSGGVTQVKFSPDGIHLFSGGRKDPEIICWDMRNCDTPYYKLVRNVGTNQRIQFDLDCTGKILVTGNTDHRVGIWDLNYIYRDLASENPLKEGYEVVRDFCAHGDAVNSVALNPALPLLATASGQRHYLVRDSDSEAEEPSNDPCIENSLRMWKMKTTGS